MSSVAQPKKERSFIAFLLSFIIPFLVILGIQSIFLQNYWVPSASMEPTLMVDDRVFGAKLINYTPTRGDIVVFRDDNSWLNPEGDQNLVKRIIGVGGDTVECCSPEGKVIVNGEPIDEPYIVGDNEDFPPQKVPEGFIFVMGDNREYSADSREHISEGTQFINDDSLLAKVWVVWMPNFRFTS